MGCAFQGGVGRQGKDGGSHKRDSFFKALEQKAWESRCWSSRGDARRHSPGVSAEGGLGDPKEPRGAHEQQEGPIRRAQDPLRVPLFRWAARGRQKQGWCGMLQGAAPPLPAHTPCTLPALHELVSVPVGSASSSSSFTA